MADGDEREASASRGGRAPNALQVQPSMVPWRLELARVEQHRLAIEHSGRELVLGFDPPVGGTALSLTRIAVVQPGCYLELPPWHTPVRSLALPWARAPLDDLWLTLSTAARRYWCEVPYGVWRAPGQRHEAPQLGPPRAPPDAGPSDLVLRWQTIRFELGHAGGWQLAVLTSRESAGELEIEARRVLPAAPPALTVTASVGSRRLAIEQRGPWGAEPAPLHVARYRFPPPPLGARGYVRLLVTFGAASFELHLPTSLTDRTHRSIEWKKAAR